MAESDAVGFAALALCDRAYAFLIARGAIAEEVLLAHVYGGQAPLALRAKLAAPLLDDPRLERGADGAWTIRGSPQQPALDTDGFTALALAASGPTPGRGRVVRIAAVHMRGGHTLGRFDVTLNPLTRVPRYVAERVGLEPEILEGFPTFASILDELAAFLGSRPVVAQDARLAWAFLVAEARRGERVLVEPLLIDANELASRVLALDSKPTLAHVAARLGIGTVQIAHPDEEARVLGEVASRLLASGLEAPVHGKADRGSVALRHGETARSLPDEPGVYVLRDHDQTPLYVGKARRLRSRMAAYVHRPLGLTRRLEGLVGAVRVVDSTRCATDLEALVLEDREIRRLRPRFNTVRLQRAPRLWIRLPAPAPPRPGKRQLAARRLELSLGPSTADGEFVGPFRNEAAAERARLLAREVFELDSLRRADPQTYGRRLQQAWHFLKGETAFAEELARRHSTRLLREVLAFDVQATLLPADPREVRYAIVRPGPTGIEGFVIDRGIFQAWAVLGNDVTDAAELAARLLSEGAPRTAPEDVDVVLRWFGAQRSTARLVCLPEDQLAAADAIEAAFLELASGEA